MSATEEPASPERIILLGIPFDKVNMSQTIGLIGRMVESKQPHYLATANVDFVVQSQHDKQLLSILHEADLTVCDGTPLIWLSRFKRKPLPERVAGSDLVPQLLAEAEKHGWGVYFLGGDEKVSAQAVANVRQTHPQLRIAGAYSPPYAPLDKMDHEGICARIRETSPDLLFVSFGCPKQEKWIAMNYRALGVPVCVGVGATIDFLAGTVKRAPRWMQVAGLEWFYRLLQEPKRLWRRYFVDSLVILKLLAKDTLASAPR